MTQEELDALMAGGLDEEMAEDNNIENDLSLDPQDDEIKEKVEENLKEVHEYRTSAGMSWPPPPPTDDHKMVYQLDDVTRDSEEKAGEVFDKLEAVNCFMVEAKDNANDVIMLIDSNIELFKSLCKKFPNVDQFKKSLADNEAMKEKAQGLIESAQMAEDEIMMTMDIMQYQDIHRQKIERVINVMRALSGYMNNLFQGKLDDDKRVGSAVHIVGDNSTEEVVSNDDIEALIESLGKK